MNNGKASNRSCFLAKADFLSLPIEFIRNLKTTRVMLASRAIRFEFTFFSNAAEVRG